MVIVSAIYVVTRLPVPGYIYFFLSSSLGYTLRVGMPAQSHDICSYHDLSCALYHQNVDPSDQAGIIYLRFIDKLAS